MKDTSQIPSRPGTAHPASEPAASAARSSAAERPARSEADVVVIGLGPGGDGLVMDLAARTGVGGGGQDGRLEVVGIDEHLIGGECPYYGCIPSKMIRHEIEHSREAGRSPEWSRVAHRIRSEATDSWDDAAAVERLETAGVRAVHGTARVTGEREVTVQLNTGGVEVIRARRAVVLNTGSESIVPPIGGAEEAGVWSHRDVLTAAVLPRRLAVVGAGVIACELGQYLAGFGVEVTMLVRGGELMKTEEPAASEILAEAFRREGIDVRFRTEIRRLSRAEGGPVTAELTDGSELEADGILVATGRRPRQKVTVDGLCRVLVPQGHAFIGEDAVPARGTEPSGWLYAIGDMTGHGPFTHVADAEARIVGGEIAAGGSRSAQRPSPANDDDGLPAPTPSATPFPVHAVPRVTFTEPEIAGVGVTEAQARKQAAEKGWEIAAVTKDLAEVSRGWIDQVRGSITLVADANEGVLVGASVVGPHAGEVIGALTLAVHAKTPLAELRRVVWAFPTLHRGIGDALRELGA
ncbi:dihydrolipoyl dehydrogenase family protein [Arthrobacter sp. UM1]|uniref:dihydrolipoyl dehydrogenase family protein n=1 Tax=Arthrobacter sp. UM1 TaxID=2766776 RepID=UPI001CF6BB79|nr:NAD(P)/FAD-dependent oxidoreductase [Arthrobacter sp. UM1]MCB4207894.1 NAD(P)/FAD-dependent oxidoreductase [Arthrobacter sp. UM1]